MDKQIQDLLVEIKTKDLKIEQLIQEIREVEQQIKELAADRRTEIIRNERKDSIEQNTGYSSVIKRYLRRNPTASIKEIMAATGYSDQTVKRGLTCLKIKY